MLTKTLKFEDDVLEVLKAMEWSNDGLHGVLVGQLDRKLYERVNKALKAMGGKWNRSAKAHIFKLDPRLQVVGLLDSGTLTVERDGFFETPLEVVNRMMLFADTRPGDIVLEPSAGLGAIAKHIKSTGAEIFCVEKNEQRAKALSEMGYQVMNEDFLNIKPERKYDVVVMNPPFEELQDISHVMHAHKFLKDEGVLVSVMGEAAFFRSNTKAKAFREWFNEISGYSEKLSEGSFKGSGTGVNCRIVVIEYIAEA